MYDYCETIRPPKPLTTSGMNLSNCRGGTMKRNFRLFLCATWLDSDRTYLLTENIIYVIILLWPALIKGDRTIGRRVYRVSGKQLHTHTQTNRQLTISLSVVSLRKSTYQPISATDRRKCLLHMLPKVPVLRVNGRIAKQHILVIFSGYDKLLWAIESHNLRCKIFADEVI